MSVEVAGHVPRFGYASARALDVRLTARCGVLMGQTSGVAPQHVQGSLALLPKGRDDFVGFVIGCSSAFGGDAPCARLSR